MSKYLDLTDELYGYLVEQGSREDEVLARVREETEALGEVSIMQIAPDQGALMTILTRLTGARRAIEIGTFTGYSAICIARGLPEGGLLVASELDAGRARTAEANFELAGVSERIDLRVGPADETLDSLSGSGPFDLAFIDADKTGYPRYYEGCLRLLREGGLILLDNVLQGGRVLEPGEEESAIAIDGLNRRIREDERVDVAMIGVADGITLARKR